MPAKLEPDKTTLALVETAVIQTLKNHSLPPPASLTLFFADDTIIQQLNRDYLDNDKPTDVLSFPAGEPMPGMTAADTYLGDIIISIPFASRQAAGAGHPLAAELQLLAVHGTLHLLGYDHADNGGKNEMWQVQSAVLKQLGLQAIHLSET